VLFTSACRDGPVYSPLIALSLQCFDAVGWAAGRASAL